MWKGGGSLVIGTLQRMAKTKKHKPSNGKAASIQPDDEFIFNRK
jgi:hypothetical protein